MESHVYDEHDYAFDCDTYVQTYLMCCTVEITLFHQRTLHSTSCVGRSLQSRHNPSGTTCSTGHIQHSAHSHHRCLLHLYILLGIPHTCTLGQVCFSLLASVSFDVSLEEVQLCFHLLLHPRAEYSSRVQVNQWLASQL